MPAELPADCRQLIALQSGVVARGQLRTLGIADDRIESLVRSGRWIPLQRGVYATFTGEPCRDALLWAAVLRAGRGVLSHQTAAHLCGLADRPSPLIHVTVLAGQHPARSGAIPGVIIHRSNRILTARHPLLQPPRTRIDETVLDLVQTAPTFADAFGWLCHAAGRRLTTAGRLRTALDGRARMRWRAEALDALAEIADGVRSNLEHRYVRDVERAHALPTARRQARIVQAGRAIYIDNLYEEFGVAVELDGRAAHPTEARFGDMRRDNANAAAGIITMRYGWAEVIGRPCETANELGVVFQRFGWDGAPRRCQPTCRIVIP
jgi:hypothetical protein